MPPPDLESGTANPAESPAGDDDGRVKARAPDDGGTPPVLISIVVARPEEEKVGKKEDFDGCDVVCRVCLQPSEEALMDLGCGCRGELAKAHRSCIDIWFRSKGSNKCEICQQVATNIPLPDSLPSSNYWVWRIEPASGDSTAIQRQRRCISPLCVAFSILCGGLLLDVLISVSLGLSALPVNIIIGVLIIVGLGTAFRLAMECCYEWSVNSEDVNMNINMSVNMTGVGTTVNPGYGPTM